MLCFWVICFELCTTSNIGVTLIDAYVWTSYLIEDLSQDIDAELKWKGQQNKYEVAVQTDKSKVQTLILQWPFCNYCLETIKWFDPFRCLPTISGHEKWFFLKMCINVGYSCNDRIVVKFIVYCGASDLFYLLCL